MLEPLTYRSTGDAEAKEVEAQVEEGRLKLKETDSCEFVDASTYCELVVGRESLTRCDDDSLNLLGLVSLTDGRRYVIESEALERHLSRETAGDAARPQSLPAQG